MTHWNYRLVREFNELFGEDRLNLVEVYYEEGDKPGGYCNIFTEFDTIEEVREFSARVLAASQKPVLTEEDFK